KHPRETTVALWNPNKPQEFKVVAPDKDASMTAKMTEKSRVVLVGHERENEGESTIADLEGSQFAVAFKELLAHQFPSNSAETIEKAVQPLQNLIGNEEQCRLALSKFGIKPAEWQAAEESALIGGYKAGSTEAAWEAIFMVEHEDDNKTSILVRKKGDNKVIA